MKIERWNSKQGENIGGINSSYTISFIVDENKKHLHINNKHKGKNADYLITIIEDGIGNYKINGQQIKNGTLTDLIFDYDSNNNLTLSDREQTYCNSSLDSLEEALKFLSMF